MHKSHWSARPAPVICGGTARTQVLALRHDAKTVKAHVENIIMPELSHAKTTHSQTSHILHRRVNAGYPRAVAGRGAFLFDDSGKDYLDASGGAAVSALGHGHPKVIAAVKAQLETLAYAHNGFFTTDVAEDLADWLVARAPAGFGRAMFVSGGSEAVEAAVKLARQVHYERGDLGRVRLDRAAAVLSRQHAGRAVAGASPGAARAV